MDINLVNFVGYFILYLFLGFIFFYFTLFKKRGSNLVGTACLILVFVSIAIGFLSAVHLAIINLFLLVLAFWFAYIIMKMHRDDKQEQTRLRLSQQRQYQKKLTKKHIDKKTE